LNEGRILANTNAFPILEVLARSASEKSVGAQERLIFIDFRCTFLGEIRRAELMARFGISSAAATRDLAQYKGVLGAKIQMDPVTKIYRLCDDFEPIFAHDVHRALTALSRGFGESQSSPVGSLVACEIPPKLSVPDVNILASVTRAINLRQVLQITYSSFSSGSQTREIVPFALADNGLRWHVRAFDRKRQSFVDFVLTRIGLTAPIPDSRIDLHELEQNDLDWGRILELELVAHPKEARPEVVAMDYAMTDGLLKVRVRAALASYLLRQWLVDCSHEHVLTGAEYRLWLRNAPILYGVANAHLAPGNAALENN
jgi:predicted DNA-binding transcriptional regulator YafY